MAIRIDLLPGYVGLRRLFKRIFAICVGLVCVFAVVLFLFYYQNTLVLQTTETNLKTYQAVATEAKTANSAKDKAEGDATETKRLVDFIVDAGRTGPERAAMVDQVRRYIYRDANIQKIDMSNGNTVSIEGVVKSTPDYIKFLYTIREANKQGPGPLFKDLPILDGNALPSYPYVKPKSPLDAQADYTIKVSTGATLLHPLTSPSAPGEAPAGNAAPGGAPVPGPGPKP